MSLRSLMKAEKARRAELTTSNSHDEKTRVISCNDVNTDTKSTSNKNRDIIGDGDIETENRDIIGDDDIETENEPLPADFFDTENDKISNTQYNFHELVEEIEKEEENIRYEYDNDFIVEETVPSLQTLLQECSDLDKLTDEDTYKTEKNGCFKTEDQTVFKYCDDDELVNDIFDAAVYGELDTAFHSELQHEVEEKQKKFLQEIEERSRPAEELIENKQIPIGFFDNETKARQHNESEHVGQMNRANILNNMDERLLELSRNALEGKEFEESFKEIMIQQRQYNEKLQTIFSQAKKRRCEQVNYNTQKDETVSNNNDTDDDLDESQLDDFDWKAKRVRNVN